MPNNIINLQEILKGREPRDVNEKEREEIASEILRISNLKRTNHSNDDVSYFLGILGIEWNDYKMLDNEWKYKKIKESSNLLSKILHHDKNCEKSDASKRAADCLQLVNDAFDKLKEQCQAKREVSPKSSQFDEVEFLKKGQEKLEQSAYISAINYCSKALQINPNLADAYQIRGCALRYLGEIACAINDFNQVLNSKTDNLIALQLRGELRHRKNDYTGAIEDFTQAMRYKNMPAMTYNFLRGVNAFIRGSFLFAVNELARSGFPKSDLEMIYLGQAKQAIGDDEGAIEILNQFSKSYPDMDYAKELLTLAVQRQSERKTTSCITGFNTLKGVEFISSRYRSEYIVSFKHGEFSLPILEQLSKSPDGISRSAIINITIGNRKKQEGTISFEAKNNVIKYLELNKYIERDDKEYHARAQPHSTFKITHTGKYYLALLHAKFPAAISTEKANETKDSSLENIKNNANEYTTVASPSSKDLYAEINIGNPHSEKIDDNNNSFSEKTGERSPPVNYPIAKKTTERTKWANATFNKLVNQYQDKSEAKPELSSLDQAEFLKQQGQEKLKQGAYTLAVEYCSKALQLNPEHVGAYRIRGCAQRYLGEIKCAIEDFDKVLSLEPNNIMALQFRGELKDRLGDINAALEDFNKINNLKENELLMAYTVSGVMAYHEGYFLIAVTYLEKAYKLSAKSDFLLIYLGKAKQALGDDKGAMLIFNELVLAYPYMAYASELLAWAQQKENERLAKLTKEGLNKTEVAKRKVSQKEFDLAGSATEGKYERIILEELAKHPNGLCRSDITSLPMKGDYKNSKNISEANIRKKIKKLEAECYIEREGVEFSKKTSKETRYKITFTGNIYFAEILSVKYPKQKLRRESGAYDSAQNIKRMNINTSSPFSTLSSLRFFPSMPNAEIDLSPSPLSEYTGIYAGRLHQQGMNYGSSKASLCDTSLKERTGNKELHADSFSVPSLKEIPISTAKQPSMAHIEPEPDARYLSSTQEKFPEGKNLEQTPAYQKS